MADPTPDATPEPVIDAIVEEKVLERLKRQQDLLTRPPEPPKSSGLSPRPPGVAFPTVDRFYSPPADPRASMPDGGTVNVSTPKVRDQHERAWKEARVIQGAALIEDLRGALQRERDRIVELRTAVDETWADVETLGKPLLDPDLAALPPGHQARVDSIDVRFLRRLAWANALKDLEHAQESERVLVAEINAAKAAIRQP